MRDCVQGVKETLGIRIKTTSWFIWQEVATLLKKEISKKHHQITCVSFNYEQFQR